MHLCQQCSDTPFNNGSTHKLASTPNKSALFRLSITLGKIVITQSKNAKYSVQCNYQIKKIKLMLLSSGQ